MCTWNCPAAAFTPTGFSQSAALSPLVRGLRPHLRRPPHPWASGPRARRARTSSVGQCRFTHRSAGAAGRRQAGVCNASTRVPSSAAPQIFATALRQGCQHGPGSHVAGTLILGGCARLSCGILEGVHAAFQLYSWGGALARGRGRWEGRPDRWGGSPRKAGQHDATNAPGTRAGRGRGERT